MNKAQQITSHELIGRKVEVVEAKNRILEGLKGVIIDETKDTLIIETGGEKKMIIKSQVTLKLNFGGKNLEVQGKVLISRSEDRIKKLRKK